jgi:hypothetical protein
MLSVGDSFSTAISQRCLDQLDGPGRICEFREWNLDRRDGCLAENKTRCVASVVQNADASNAGASASLKNASF